MENVKDRGALLEFFGEERSSKGWVPASGRNAEGDRTAENLDAVRDYLVSADLQPWTLARRGVQA